MEKITAIGLDIGKHVFQVHGVNDAGAVIARRKLRRDDVAGFFKALPPCLIGGSPKQTSLPSRGRHRWCPTEWCSWRALIAELSGMAGLISAPRRAG